MSAANSGGASNAKHGIWAGTMAALVLCIGLVKPWEGDVKIPYRDSVNVLTVCFGHTGSDIQNRPYTVAECEELLRLDLIEANQTVHRCISAPMLPHQESALTSFAFNIGPGRAGRLDAEGRIVGGKDGLCILRNGRQPRVRRFANAGDWPGACAAMSDWNKAGGKVLRGLTNRRTAERAMCEGKKLK